MSPQLPYPFYLQLIGDTKNGARRSPNAQPNDFVLCRLMNIHNRDIKCNTLYTQRQSEVGCGSCAGGDWNHGQQPSDFRTLMFISITPNRTQPNRSIWIKIWHEFPPRVHTSHLALRLNERLLSSLYVLARFRSAADARPLAFRTALVACVRNCACSTLCDCWLLVVVRTAVFVLQFC